MSRLGPITRVFAALTALLMCAGMGTPIALAGPPTALPSVVPCAAVQHARLPQGTQVTDAGGLKIVVPTPGLGLFAEAYMITGSEELTVLVDADGIVSVTNCGDEVASASESSSASLVATASPSACSDTARKKIGFSVIGHYHWSYEPATTPSNLTVTQAENGIQDGLNAMWGINNDCGMEGFVDGGNSPIFDGTVSGGNGVPTNGECVHNSVQNGRNVMNFQSLPSGTIGLTCVAFTNTLVEADMSFNKNLGWVVGDGGAGCSGKYSIHAIATHEAGHVYNLDDLDESTHGNLTMSAQSNGPCQQSEYTLGRGDVLGRTT